MVDAFYNYPNEVLLKLQNVQIEILKKFDEICQKYGIVYWATYGTAIGAVRHHGFIPWDDDIDLGIMLDDYDKLKKVPKEEWGEYEFVTGADDNTYHHALFAKVYKKNSVLETQWRIDYAKQKGIYHSLPIWIDLFIYNHVKDIKEVKRNISKAVLYRKLYWCSKNSMRVKQNDSFRMKLGCFSRILIHKLLNVINNPEKRIFNRFSKFLRKIDKGGGKYVTTFTCLETYEMTGVLCEEKDMFPIIRMPFGDTTIPMQKNYHEILTNLYGDYMQLPPEEKRINHCPAILDLGDGQGNLLESYSHILQDIRK